MPILLNAAKSDSGWSSIGDFFVCQRKLGFRRENQAAGTTADHDSEALVFGSLFHLGCAHFYARLRCAQQGSDPEAYYTPNEAMSELAMSFGALGARLLPKALEVLRVYMQIYAHERFNVLHVEEQFSTILGGRTYTARYDLVVKDVKGRVWIYDHKTTARLKPNTFTKYVTSGQMLGQRYIGREQWGVDFAGIIINGVQHSPPVQFQRQILPEAPNLQEQFPSMIQWAEERLVQLGTKPAREWPGAANEAVCHGPYGPCDYLKQCTGIR